MPNQHVAPLRKENLATQSEFLDLLAEVGRKIFWSPLAVAFEHDTALTPIEWRYDAKSMRSWIISKWSCIRVNILKWNPACSQMWKTSLRSDIRIIQVRRLFSTAPEGQRLENRRFV